MTWTVKRNPNPYIPHVVVETENDGAIIVYTKKAMTAATCFDVVGAIFDAILVYIDALNSGDERRLKAAIENLEASSDDTDPLLLSPSMYSGHKTDPVVAHDFKFVEADGATYKFTKGS